MKRLTSLLLCALMAMIACVSLTGCGAKYENLDGDWKVVATGGDLFSAENLDAKIDSENLTVSIGGKTYAYNKVKFKKNDYIKEYSEVIFTTENSMFVDKTPGEKFTFTPFGESVMWCTSIPSSYRDKERPTLLRKCATKTVGTDELEVEWMLDGLVDATKDTITINEDALVGAYSYKYLKLSNGEKTDGMVEFSKDGDKLILTDNGTVCEITEISYSAKYGPAVKITCEGSGYEVDLYILEYSENHMSVVYSATSGIYTNVDYNYLVKEL